MSRVPSGDHRGRSSEASVARTDLRSSPLEAMTSISNPVEVTTLNASCDPSDDQAGLRPPTACGRSVLSAPVSGSTASSWGEPLRVVAKPIREPSGDHCGFVVQPRGVDELPHPGTVRIHDIDVPVTVPVRAEGQSGAVWGPGGIKIGVRIAGDLGQA